MIAFLSFYTIYKNTQAFSVLLQILESLWTILRTLKLFLNVFQKYVSLWWMQMQDSCYSKLQTLCFIIYSTATFELDWKNKSNLIW